MRKTILPILLALVMCAAPHAAYAATEFVSTIKAEGGDYSALSSWESAMQCGLTSSRTKVFSVSSTTGTVADGATVTGQYSGNKATVVHATASQIMLKYIRTPLTGTLTFPDGGSIWTASTAYDVGDVVRPSDGSIYAFTCTTAGTSGATAPTWLYYPGAVVSDGTVVWSAHTIRSVTGSGTAFQTELQVGDYIMLESEGIWVGVSSITNNTTIALSTSYLGSGGSGTASVNNGDMTDSEQMSVDGSNYVVAGNAGDSVIVAAECYPMTDTPIVIDGFTTSPTNYIHIYTASGYQHNGAWTSGCYNITSPATSDGNQPDHCIAIMDKNVHIEGLQLNMQWLQHWGGCIQISHGHWTLPADAYIWIDKVLAKGTAYDGWARKGVTSCGSASNATILVTNSVFFDYGTNGNSAGIYIANIGYRAYVYNCTFDHEYNGIMLGDVNTEEGVLVKNCVASRVTVGYNQALASTNAKYHSDSDYVTATNADTNDYFPGTHYYQGDPTFVDLANDNYRLSDSDTLAKGAGTDLSGVFPSNDVGGDRRDGATWDIGADQTYTEVTRLIRAGRTISSMTRASNVVTVTLASDYPNSNLKVDQPIVISGVRDTWWNGYFKIASVTDQSTFTYNNVGPDATSASGGTAGGDYATLQAWDDDFGGVAYTRLSADDGDLVTAQKKATAACYNDWASGAARASIDGFTTNASYYVKVYAPTSERHDGTAKDASGNYTGFTIKPTTIYSNGIQFSDNYTRIDGIVVDLDDQGYTVGFLGGTGGSATGSQLTNCIAFNGKRTGTDYGSFMTENSGIIYLINCLAYDGYRGFHTRAWTQSYVYNCTAVNNVQYGFYAGTANYSQTYKNCLSSGNGTADFYKDGTENTFTLSYSASSDGTATTAGDAGTGNRADQTFVFASTTAGAEDYHLLDTDTGAKTYGTDLSSDAVFPFSTDIDGSTRLTGIWDIGIDQTPTKIYRSVGPTTTTALATQSSPTASNTLTINATTGAATFSAALPPNVGVGDVIQYDDNGTATPDQLAFISGRTSTTQFIVRKADGTLPAGASSNLNWGIYRAYISLANAEAGTENTGLNDTLESFDAFSGGKDLVTANEQWNIACYADAADTTSVSVDGWTTGSKNYLKIYAPVSGSEVGVSQRHLGNWSTSAYRLEYTATADSLKALDVEDAYTRLEGLQVSFDNAAYTSGMAILNKYASYNRVSSCLIKGGASTDGAYGIYFSDDATYGLIWNNIVYDFSTYGIYGRNNLSLSAYNNTVVGCGVGIGGDASVNMRAKNNIVRGCTDGYANTFTGDSTNNLSDLASDAPGSNPINSTTVSFVDYANRNLHLSTADTGATGAGVDLSADTYIAFSSDVDSGTRWDPWSVGADQPALSVASGVTTGNWNTPATWASGAVPSATQDVIIAAGKTITFDKNDSSLSQTCGTLTVYGTLVINTTTAANRTMVVNGNIIVKNGGILTIRSNSNTSYSTSIKFNCQTNVQYGLIVEGGGTLDIQGTSKYDPDVVITALTQDGSHNAYIYCQNLSKTKIKFADISYMGANVSTKYGIHVASVENAGSSEYFYIEGCRVHSNYMGVRGSSSKFIIYDNDIYECSSYGAVVYDTEVISNRFYNNGGHGIVAYVNSKVINNICYGNTQAGIYLAEGGSIAYNNTCDNNADGIEVQAGYTGHIIKNNIVSNASGEGIDDNGTSTVIDRNLFYGNTANGSTGTNAITGSNPNFVSTDSSSVDFMYVAADSPALGAGCRVDTGGADSSVNIGARLGYVENITDNIKFNSLQAVHDAPSYNAGDTIKIYSVYERKEW